MQQKVCRYDRHPDINYPPPYGSHNMFVHILRSTKVLSYRCNHYNYKTMKYQTHYHQALTIWLYVKHLDGLEHELLYNITLEQFCEINKVKYLL